MEIDFQKLNRSKSGSHNFIKKQDNIQSFSRKLALGVSALVVTFTIGLISGMSLGGLQNFNTSSFAPTQATQELVTPDVAPQQETTLNDSVQINVANAQTSENSATPQTQIDNEDKDKKTSTSSYLILANIYENKNSAHSAGLMLQKESIPVFLAASGTKMKLYVGPVEGEKSARNLLARIKKMPEFRGAILYKK